MAARVVIRAPERRDARLPFPRTQCDLGSTMRLASWIFSLTVCVAACTPGSPVYFGPPILTLQGTVSALETGAPLAHAEVCVFASDTLCVGADNNGHYSAALLVSELLEGGRADVRFRASGYPTAILQLSDLAEGKREDTNCIISTRVTLSRQPVACISSDE